MVWDPPASAAVQAGLPPAVHPEPHQELSLHLGVEGAGHQAVVAHGQGHHLRHLANILSELSYTNIFMLSNVFSILDYLDMSCWLYDCLYKCFLASLRFM